MCTHCAFIHDIPFSSRCMDPHYSSDHETTTYLRIVSMTISVYECVLPDRWRLIPANYLICLSIFDTAPSTWKYTREQWNSPRITWTPIVYDHMRHLTTLQALFRPICSFAVAYEFPPFSSRRLDGFFRLASISAITLSNFGFFFSGFTRHSCLHFYMVPAVMKGR